MTCIASINIRSGRAGGLEAALLALRHGNTGIGVLQETKLTRGIHTQYSLGYKVWATDSERRHRGGIAIVWREEEGWKVEVVTNFGPNMVSFTITSGRRRWYVVGAYAPPNDQP